MYTYLHLARSNFPILKHIYIGATTIVVLLLFRKIFKNHHVVK